MARVAYQEGDWFTLPLRTNGFGLGVVVRANPDGVLFRYFFGPRHLDEPTLQHASSLRPGQTVLVARLGFFGIVAGKSPTPSLLVRKALFIPVLSFWILYWLVPVP